ncbi:MAG: DsrE family protein [Syntrophobacteraceae bacterium]
MKNVMVAAMFIAFMSTMFSSQCNAEESRMNEKERLYILWTNSDPVTADKMVFMYALNSLKKGWWKEITIVIWGSTAKLTGENAAIQSKMKGLIAAGVKVSACKACADELGVTEKLLALGIEVKYWGQPLTEIIRAGQFLLTI